MQSHASVPVTGTLPYGSLRIHEIMDSTPSHEAGAGGQIEEMPELEEPTSPGAPGCLQNGDAFVVLDLPENFTVGCDAVAMNVGGSKFLGIRDLPPGPHFIWVSEPNAMSRCGYWFVTGQTGEVRVKQWDRYNEVLGEAASQFEVREQKDNIEALYPQLMPYGFHDGSDGNPPTPPPKDPPRSTPEPDFAVSDTLIWRRLTDSITEGLLRRVTGKKDVDEWLVDTSDSAKGELHFPQTSRLFKTVVGSELSFLFPQDAVDLQLLNLVGRDHPAASATAITNAPADGPDTSAEILAVLDKSPSAITEEDVVGELQFTFLNGIHLSNLSCIEQWWHLVLRVFLRSPRLAVTKPALCRSLIQTLHAQMIYNDKYIAGAPGDKKGRGEGTGLQQDSDGGHSIGILEIIPQNSGKLREALTAYKRRLNKALLDLGDKISQEQGAVGHAFVDLEAWFWKYGWDLRSDYVREKLDGEDDEDDDEYQPVVVDLDENGREVGLVSWN